MTNRFTPWPKADGRYGAIMGRTSAKLDLDSVEGRIDALAVAGPAGEYDAGGAYWGLGASLGGVYAVWIKGRGREGVAYVRANSRIEAQLHVLSDIAYRWRFVSVAAPWGSPYSTTWALDGIADYGVLWQGGCGASFVRRMAEEHGLDVETWPSK